MHDQVIPSPLHFSCYWNLEGKWNPQAPAGMRIWADLLNNFRELSSDQQYAWYGKISLTKLGIPKEIVPDLNLRIRAQNESGAETRLYLYTYYELQEMKVPYSLHVAKVLELRGQDVYKDEEEKRHIPLNFYDKIREDKFGSVEDQKKWEDGDAIPFFFKISDIRELNISDADHLEEATSHTTYQFKPFEWHDRISPSYIREKPIRYEPWFSGKTRWWEEVLNTAEDLDPGKFQTESVKRIYYQALQYAGINRPILIVGERGTGKSRLARFIRRNSIFFKEGERYSDTWPLISCGIYENPAQLETELFGNEARLTGETLVLDDFEHLPHPLARRILSRYESTVKAESGSKNLKAFRIIACTSLRPYQIYDRLDDRFLDACAAVLELPSLYALEAADKETAWRFQYEQVKRRLLSGETVRELTDDEKKVLYKLLLNHRLPGNYRDLQRLATRIILELKSRTISGIERPMCSEELQRIFKEVFLRLTLDPTTPKEEAEALAWTFLSDRFERTTKKEFDKQLECFKSWARYGWADRIDKLKKSGDKQAERIHDRDKDTVYRYLREEGPNKDSAATPEK